MTQEEFEQALGHYAFTAIFTHVEHDHIWQSSSMTPDEWAKSFDPKPVFETESLEKMESDLRDFFTQNEKDILTWDGDDPFCQAAHDFWLTRNGHGAGFWDGDWEHEAGERLTADSKRFGEVSIYSNDHNELCCF